MSRRSRDTDELIRQKVLLGSQLASKHPEYVAYSGGSYYQIRKMAIIGWLLTTGLAKKNLAPILKLLYTYLDEDRKAWFMTDGSDVLTKLSAIVGVEKPESANDTVRVRIHRTDKTTI